MVSTVNRFDALSAGLCSALLKKYNSVVLNVHEDGETFNLTLGRGKKSAEVHLSGELVARYESGIPVDDVVAEIDALYKEATK